MNRHFYDDGAGRFSATRQRPWQGWRELLPELRQAIPGGRVLDAGCGNGRFAAFLAAEGLVPEAYLGLDGSEPLLADARAAVPDPPFAFLRIGLEEMAESLGGQVPDSFDVIALFGVLHHVPGRSARQEFMESLAARLAPGGFLLVSFWLLDRFPERFAKLRLGDGELAGELEAGDALLSFDGRPDRPRYCHFPNEAEIDALCRLPGCLELRRFRADGPSGGDNLYAVLRQDPAAAGRDVISSTAPHRS